MKTAIVSLTPGGHGLAARLSRSLANSTVLKIDEPVAKILERSWHRYDGFICIMAAGIVVRSVASLLKDKQTDPCVVVVDEKGRFAISLISGHLGGGNALALEVAALLGGEAVITTASDNLGLTALDLWARENGLLVENKAALTRASAQLVKRKVIRLFSEVPAKKTPLDFVLVNDPQKADLIVSNRTGDWPGVAILRPVNLVLGVGCNRGTPEEEIEQAVASLFLEHHLARNSIRNLASIDLKKDEPGLLAFASRHNLTLDFFNKDELNTVPGISKSEYVMKATGAVGVSEPAALLSAGIENLLIRKQKWKNVTLAVAEIPYILSAPAPVT